MKNVAIIGSNGFIGSHLTDRLSREKEISIHLFGRNEKSSLDNRFPYKKIDFSDTKSLEVSFSDMDVVYYLASETIPASSWDTPLIEIEKNLTPFIKFLEVLSKLRVRKLAFISSAGTVYGTTSGKVPENSDKKPFSPYGITKLAMENFLNYYKTKYKLQYDIYRISNVYGEGQNTGKGLGVINTFLEDIIRKNKITVYGDGSTTRNYIYVKDVAELLTFSVRDSDASAEFNLSSNDTLSISSLIQLIQGVVTENFEVNNNKGRQSDNSYIDLDNSKILSVFPKFEFTPIRSGILITYNALKQMKENTTNHD